MNDRHSILDSITGVFVPIHRDGYKFVAGAAVAALVLFLISDTLGWIASRHGTTVSAIREANTLKGHLIHTGDTLVIPTSRVSGKLASNPLLQKKRYSQYYRVASGDSLWSISRRLGVTIGALVRANHLDPKAPLSIGQRLSVPSRTIAAR